MRIRLRTIHTCKYGDILHNPQTIRAMFFQLSVEVLMDDTLPSRGSCHRLDNQALSCVDTEQVTMSARLFSFQPVRPVFGSAKCFGCRSVRMRTAAATKRHAVRCNASTPDAASSEPKLKLTRRATLVSLAGVAIGTTADVSHPLAAEAKQTAQVGTYLPPSDIEGFSLFVPDRSKTPVRPQRNLLCQFACRVQMRPDVWIVATETCIRPSDSLI
jgi:hypothetical protein